MLLHRCVNVNHKNLNLIVRYYSSTAYLISQILLNESGTYPYGNCRCILTYFLLT